MGASFDRELMAEVAKQHAAECRAKNLHVLLAPTVNLVRGPLGGRSFEFFSEDPYLSGEMAIAFVTAMQAENIGTCLKHFVGNEFETDKHNTNCLIPARAMREVYLEPFRAVIKAANPWAVMPAYNKIGGVPCSENKWLLRQVLREEWGYDGAVISDWYGVHDAAASIKAGCDIEMPGKPIFRTLEAMSDLVVSRKVSQRDLDASTKYILKLFKRTMAAGVPYEDDTETTIDTPKTRELLARSAAAGVVLLKNERSVLPISPETKRIAVIGGCAALALTSGGGAAGTPYENFKTTPLEAIQEKALAQGMQVEYTPGVLSHKFTPVLDPYMRHPDTAQMGRAKIEFWKNKPAEAWSSTQAGIEVKPEPAHVLDARGVRCFIHDGVPQDICDQGHYVRVLLDFVPPHRGDWTLGLTAGNSGHVFLDGKHIIDYENDLEDGSLFFNYCHKEKTYVLKDAEEGRAYRLEYRCWATDHHLAFTVPMAAGFQLGAAPAIEPAAAIRQAVEVAKGADLSVVVVGLGKDIETEGYDRDTMDLPGASDELVAALLATSTNVIVVTQSGLPVTMPWTAQAPTMVHQFYGGSAVGTGLADVLFGHVNPSGKLPITFPKNMYDSPASFGFGKSAPSTGAAYYQEDIFIGHRYFDRTGIKPLFPFGHGLSYTTFEYSDLSIARASGGSADTDVIVEFTVRNTGDRAGHETAMVFVQDVKCSFVRPERELKGFTKVHLEAGEQKVLSVALDREAFKFWDDLERDAWVVEAGEFVVHIGPSSAVLPLKASVEIGQTVTWRGL